MQDQLSLLLPLGAAVEDRLAMLKAASGGKVPPPVRKLMADIRAWIVETGEDIAARTAAADALIARCAELEAAAREEMGWAEMMGLSMFDRLATLIAGNRDCRDI